ncbi:galactosyltransferase-related protein [Streptomyces sp. SID10853]|uniref:glycosyltransferase n=1 Tax=Streptomyces sp. SID10853 TaxID=2706028 RepID=UPI001EF3241A|nr:galactosyltransferase-related protein [Streptomyces sp. SID10853]
MMLDPQRILAGAVVAGLDPSARMHSAPRWKLGLPHCRAALRGLEAIGARHHPLLSVLRDMTDGADAPSYYDKLLSALSACEGDDESSRHIDRLSRAVTENVRLLYFSADAHEFAFAGGAEAPLNAPGPGLVPPGDTGRISIIIPFRSRENTGLRVRNLRACLAALRRQSLDRAQYSVTLVESDYGSHHSQHFASEVDNYLHHRDSGPFNKSAAVNHGVAEAAGDAILCLLDADMILPPTFLERMQSQVTAGSPLLPYEDALCLDFNSSARLASAVEEGNGTLRGTYSGYLLRRPPGGCVMISSEDFQAIGGFDTRFSGWGGEDRDFINRLEAIAPVRREPGILLHLLHERPDMRDDHDGIMRTALRGGGPTS